MVVNSLKFEYIRRCIVFNILFFQSICISQMPLILTRQLLERTTEGTRVVKSSS